MKREIMVRPAWLQGIRGRGHGHGHGHGFLDGVFSLL
jgi:hypothetical protein